MKTIRANQVKGLLTYFMQHEQHGKSRHEILKLQLFGSESFVQQAPVAY